MDPTSFAAPSRVRVLAVPVSPQTANEFTQYLERLKRAENVPLIDVHLPGSTSDVFDPKSNPTGTVFYSFSNASTPAAHNVLLDLEPWRKQMIVVGIHSSNSISESHDESLKMLRKKYPSAIYHAIISFTDAEFESKPSIFNVQTSNWTSVELVMSQLTGEFLASLGDFWTARQLASFQSPLELLPESQKKLQATDLRSHNHHISKHAHRLSITKHGSISMNSTEKAKQRQNGRSQKFLGSLMLLAGFPANALAELGQAAQFLLHSGDHLWAGVALNEISVCLALLVADSAPIHVPPVALSAAWSAAQHAQPKASSSKVKQTENQQKPSLTRRGSVSSQHSLSVSPTPSASSTHPVQTSIVSHSKKKKPFSNQTPVDEIIEYLIAAVLDEFALGQNTELVPYTVYYETVTRYSGYLVNLRFKDLRYSLDGVELRDSITTPKFHSTSSTISKVDHWISRVYDLSTNLSPDTQAKILGTAARLYAACGMKRKWAFVCAQIVSLLASSNATIDADLGEVHNVLRVFATWPKLEAQVLRKLVALGHRIKNPQLQTTAASRLLHMVSDSRLEIPGTEQLTLYHLIRNSGEVVQSPFWDNNIVVNANIRSLRLTTAPSRSKLGNIDGIIYNPFDNHEIKEETSVEAGVPTRARIWLRNPLAVDIQVFKIGLINKDGELVSKLLEDFVVPALSHQFRVDTTIIPHSCQTDGVLQVSGCLVQVSGCAATISVLNEPISIPIVPPRPVLALQGLSLLKGSVMMLEGEKRDFEIELWNSSQTECKFIQYSCNEVLPQYNNVVQGIYGGGASINASNFPNQSKRDTSRIDLFEYELNMHKRKAITLQDDELLPILPQQSQKYTFRLFGKPGLQGGGILIDYGYAADKLRRLKIPLQISMHRSVWIEHSNILPSGDKILLVLDVRNGWRKVIKCNIWARAQDEVKRADLVPIDPGASQRLLLEVPWESPAKEDLTQQIPLQNPRLQNTIDRHSKPEQLERFWLREKLLGMLCSKWETDGRQGEIELRKIELNNRGMDILRGTTIEIVGNVCGSAHKMDKPVTMNVSVSNKSDHKVHGMLRLTQNKASQKFMLSMGCAQQLLALAPLETRQLSFDLVFVSSGIFEIATVFDFTSGSTFQTNKTVIYIERD